MNKAYICIHFCFHAHSKPHPLPFPSSHPIASTPKIRKSCFTLKKSLLGHPYDNSSGNFRIASIRFTLSNVRYSASIFHISILVSGEGMVKLLHRSKLENTNSSVTPDFKVSDARHSFWMLHRCVLVSILFQQRSVPNA